MKEQLEAIRKGALEAIEAAQETAGLEALRNGGMAQSDNALTATSSNSEMAARMDAMYEVVTKYLPRLASRQIVLDSGTLVGELSDGMNRTLGRNLL